MNNTVNTTNLISCSIKYGVEKFIFSSTAAVYGEPENIDQKGISENSPCNPINPYGMSKLMTEHIIRDTSSANPNFKYVILRYFNVAGADIKYIDNIPFNLRPAAICESLLDKAERQKGFVKSITEAGYLVGKI